MIVGLSTSSPQVSVALFTDKGVLIATHEKLAPQAASSAALAFLENLLSENRTSIQAIKGLVCDAGPGSFTGVKVGVTLLKTLGFALGVQVAAVSSFDLMIHHENIAVPIRKGHYILRKIGEVPEPCSLLPEGTIGYGIDFETQNYPYASRIAELFLDLKWVSAFELLPYYVLEPNISKPNKPFNLLSNQL